MSESSDPQKGLWSSRVSRGERDFTPRPRLGVCPVRDGVSTPWLGAVPWARVHDYPTTFSLFRLPEVCDVPSFLRQERPHPTPTPLPGFVDVVEVFRRPPDPG